MAKESKITREEWNRLKDIQEEREAESAKLEQENQKLVDKVRRSSPKKVPSKIFTQLGDMWEVIRKAHIAERNAKQDADIYTVKALECDAISESEVKEYNPYETRGGLYQNRLGMGFGPFNPTFSSDRKMSAHDRELLEAELSAWDDITPTEAHDLFIQATVASDSDLSFDERCIEIFQKTGKTWKKNRAFFDIETTLLDPYLGEIIEIGILVISPDGEIVREFDERFDLEREDMRDTIGVGMTELHKIAPSDVIGKRKFSHPEVQREVGEILNDPNIVIVAHNAGFEHSHLSQHLDGYHAAHVRESGESLKRRTKVGQTGVASVSTTDTRVISCYLMRSKTNKLEEFATVNGISQEEYTDTAHGAYADAKMTFRATWNYRETMQELAAGERVIGPKYNKPKR